MNSKTFEIDDITWNDLDLERVYDEINTASSSVGSEYLKKVLRTLELSEEKLKSRDEIADLLNAEPDLKEKLIKRFSDLGRVKKISFADQIRRLDDAPALSNTKHYILAALLLCAAALIFIKPVIGIIALVVMFAVNISLYFADKAKIETYFICLKYLVRMIECAGRLAKLPLDGTPLEDHAASLKELYRTFAPLKRGSWLLTNSVSGSLADVVMDYVRMLFHVDLIKFNNMRALAIDRSAETALLYEILGEIETCLCISRFRSVYECSKPVLSSDAASKVSFRGIYHPLTKDPVRNDLFVQRSILLTGSNASGKSTFLKSVALNQIFAQTIYTVLADEFCSRYFKVISSMALTDSILNNESYFVVEIRSLKRIFDELGDVSVMGLIDEVLRGTNTKERIAASSVILKKLSGENALIFAATHDIELTGLLKDHMDNYHFSETVNESSVEFDYLIKKGPSDSRNAIKLLEVYGFDRDIVEEAEKLAGE